MFDRVLNTPLRSPSYLDWKSHHTLFLKCKVNVLSSLLTFFMEGGLKSGLCHKVFSPLENGALDCITISIKIYDSLSDTINEKWHISINIGKYFDTPMRKNNCCWRRFSPLCYISLIHQLVPLRNHVESCD